MSCAVHTEIRRLLQCIEILSSSSFKFKNQSFNSEGNCKTAVYSIINSCEPVCLKLKDIIYHTYHCRNASFAEYDITNHFQHDDIHNFIYRISRSNTGTRTWDPGWQVLRVEEDGQLAVQKNGLILWASPKQFKSKNANSNPGASGCLRTVKEALKLVPGFYTAFGNTSFEQYGNNNIILRLYWNIKKSHVNFLMKYLTKHLNLYNIPFSLKVLSNPHHYPRTDAAVLYIEKHGFDESKKHILATYQNLKNFMNPLTSLFTKRLAAGLGLAENPHNNESFGENRSRILSEAIYITNKKYMSLEERISEVECYFNNNGIDLDKPYLKLDSIDNYDIL